MISLTLGLTLQCGALCDQTSAFNCRSFTFIESSSTCLLSGEDTASAGLGALTGRQGTDYYQRGPCLERKSQCDLCTSLCPLYCTLHTHRDLSPPQTQETGTTTRTVTGGQPGGLTRFVQHNLHLSQLVVELGGVNKNISALLTTKNFQCINNLVEEKELGAALL